LIIKPRLTTEKKIDNAAKLLSGGSRNASNSNEIKASKVKTELLSARNTNNLNRKRNGRGRK
jgi:hypothetical protein